MDKNYALAKELLKKDDVKDVYLQLGLQLHGKSAFPYPAKKLIENAENWFSHNREELVKAITTPH